MQINSNYFQFFGVDAKFDVDVDLIKQRYREFQKLAHPDKFVNSSDAQRVLALQQAGFINDAYQTLLSPVARAKYLLKLRGVDLANDNSTIADTDFLMEQMELREALADIPHAQNPQGELRSWLSRVQERINEIEAQLQNEFAQTNSGALTQLANTVRKYQFFIKLREEARDLELELEE